MEKGLIRAVLTSFEGRFRLKNAIDPAIILFRASCFLFIAGLYFRNSVEPWVAWILGGSVVGTLSLAAFGYIYFALVDPDRLHSEDYLAERLRLEKIEDKEGVRLVGNRRSRRKAIDYDKEES